MRNGGFGKRFFLLFFLSLVSINGAARTNVSDDLPRGALIEKVVCRNDGDQSYALYLPSNYAPEKKWAVLYVFDPFGRGKIAVETFREAAERFGFVVVGSNNSRNNTGAEKLSAIIEAFWTDSHARFSINEKRVYAAGLSGGARVATYFALSCRGCVAGAIVCGATFPPAFQPDKPLTFPIFGTVGTNDFNYPELVKTFSRLDEINSANQLAVFDGRHGWLPKELTFAAFEWLNLQAMKTGSLETDKNFIASSFTKRTGEARTLFQKGDVLEAARAFEDIVKDFKDFADTKEAAESLAEIRGGKSYKKSKTDEKNSFDEQQRTAAQIIATNTALIDPASKNTASARAAKEIEIWQRRANAESDSTERRLAKRILEQVFVQTYETALYVNEQQRDYELMSANLQLARLVNQQNAQVLFELARAFALAGKKSDALALLEQSFENGFKDCARLNENAEWKIFSNDKNFRKIIEQSKCQTQEK